MHTGDIYSARAVQRLTVDVINGHMAHKEHEAYPWHIRAFDVGCNGISAPSTNEEGAYAIPEIEKSYQIKQRDTSTVQ